MYIYPLGSYRRTKEMRRTKYGRGNEYSAKVYLLLKSNAYNDPTIHIAVAWLWLCLTVEVSFHIRKETVINLVEETTIKLVERRNNNNNNKKNSNNNNDIEMAEMGRGSKSRKSIHQ